MLHSWWNAIIGALGKATKDLHDAAAHGDAAQVRKLLRSLADSGDPKGQRAAVNALAPSGAPDAHTPLWAASAAGHADAVAALLECAAVDPALPQSGTGETPLYAASRRGHEAVVAAFAAALGDAAADADAGAAAALWNAARPGDGDTPLCAASELGHLGVARRLAAVCWTDPNLPRGGTGATPLLLAATGGHAELVGVLVGAGAKPDLDLGSSRLECATPLFVASRSGCVDIVRTLVTEAKADVNKCRADDGRSPLFVASQFGHAGVVEVLISQGHPDVNKATRKDGRTPVLVASEFGFSSVVDLLICKGRCDVNQAANDGSTPLMAASGHGHTEVVELLIKKGHADVNKAKSGDGCTALLMASENGHAAVVRVLISEGHANNGHANVVDVLITEGHADVSISSNSSTPLFVACLHGHVVVSDILITKGHADPNELCAVTSQTPLHIACEKGHEKVVELLIKKENVDINKPRGDNGVTPLQVASAGGHTTVVQKLICAGVSIPQNPSKIFTEQSSLLLKAFWKSSSRDILVISKQSPPEEKGTSSSLHSLNEDEMQLIRDIVGTELFTSCGDITKRQATAPRIVRTLDSACYVWARVMKRPSKRLHALHLSCGILKSWLANCISHCNELKDAVETHLTTSNSIVATHLEASSKVKNLQIDLEECEHELQPSHPEIASVKLAFEQARAHSQVLWWFTKEKEVVQRELVAQNTKFSRLWEVVSNKTLRGLTEEEVADLLIPEIYYISLSPGDSSADTSPSTQPSAITASSLEDSWQQDVRDQFIQNHINGEALEQLTNDDMLELHMNNLLHRKALCHLVENVHSFGTMHPWQSSEPAVIEAPASALQWTENQVAQWLLKEGFDQVTLAGTTKSPLVIPGWAFVHLTHPDLRALGLTIGDARRLSTKIALLKSACFTTSTTVTQKPPLQEKTLTSHIFLEAICATTWKRLNDEYDDFVDETLAKPGATQGLPQTSSNSATLAPESVEILDEAWKKSLNSNIYNIVTERQQHFSVRENEDPPCDLIAMKTREIHCRYPTGRPAMLSWTLQLMTKITEELNGVCLLSISSVLRNVAAAHEASIREENTKKKAAATKVQLQTALEELELSENLLAQSEEVLCQSIAQSRAERELLTWISLEKNDIQRNLDATQQSLTRMAIQFAKKSFAGLSALDISTIIIPELDLFSATPSEQGTSTEAREKLFCDSIVKNLVNGQVLDCLPDDEVLSQLGLTGLIPRKSLHHFIRCVHSFGVPKRPQNAQAKAKASTVCTWDPDKVHSWLQHEISSITSSNSTPGTSASPTIIPGSTAHISTPASTSTSSDIPGWVLIHLNARDLMHMFPSLPLGVVCRLANSISLLCDSVFTIPAPSTHKH
ncbi:Ankyrin repeat protein [Pelomyxa schiedti]|nr:Ankyrin repeat protein [Pelomyxa schiedti]